MSDLKGTSPPDYKATAEKLLSAANDGAKSLKALFFWYVGALAYAVISVAGVTDEQLLKASPLKLPILSVDIPLVEYFAILPLVVVLIHLELLVQFALLSNKVNDFKSGLRHLSADEASDFRLRLENFMLSHLLAGKHNAILHTLLFLLIQGALVALPLFSLLTIQAQFLAYHSEPMMWWHRVLVLFDALALLYFWPNLFHREDMKAGAWLKLMAFRVVPRVVAFLILLAAIYALLAWRWWPLANIGVVLGLVMVTVIILCLRAARWRRGQRIIHAVGHHLARWVLLPLYLVATVAIAYWIDRTWVAREALIASIAVFAVFAVVLAGLAVAKRGNLAEAPRTLCTKTLRWAGRSHDQSLRRDAPGMAAFGAQCILAIATSGWLLSIPNEDESTVELASVCNSVPPAEGAKVAWSDYEWKVSGWHWLLRPAILSSDCFWGAELPGDTIDGRASVPAILLNGISMRRVLVLDEKVLVNQELTPVQRQKLRSGDADARRDIEPIDLRGRDLTGIQLNDAVLPRARFDKSTRLENASLGRVQLQGSIIPNAGLRWNQITHASVQGVVFERSSILDGALLDAKDLSDTTFVEGSISGALLDRVILRGARFDETRLEQTVLIDPVGIDTVLEQPRYTVAETCLLVMSTGNLPEPPQPNCAFVIYDGSAARATAPTPEFWTGFWKAQMQDACAAGGEQGAEHFMDAYRRLTNALFAHGDIQGDMAKAAISVAIDDSCRHPFSRRDIATSHHQLASEIAVQAESGVLPTTVRQDEAFFGAWLEELDRIEKAAQPVGNTTAP